MKTIQNVKLSMIDGSTETGDVDQAFLRLQLMCKNKQFAVVKMKFADDDRQASITIERLAEDYASLSKIYSPEHVMLTALTTVLHNFTDDHEFYEDIFTDEDGDSSLEFDALMP